MNRIRANRIVLTATAGLLLLVFSSRAADTAAATPSINTLEIMERELGITNVTVRVTAAGYMIDFRYRVVDAEKAAPLAKRENKAFMIDQATKAKMLVPTTPKVGSLRQTTTQPITGRVYGAIFANPTQLVKAGSLVTVVVGDCRIENLVVE